VHDDVDVRNERIERRRRLRRPQVERDAALVAIENVEVHADAVRQRRHVARVIAPARVLELDDVGPEVREHQRRVGAGEKPREIQHADAVERLTQCRVRRRALCEKPYVKYSTSPMTSQIANRSQALRGRPSMMYTQPSADSVHTPQTSGTRNGRGRSGSLYRSTRTPILTSMNAKSVPMLVRS